MKPVEADAAKQDKSRGTIIHALERDVLLAVGAIFAVAVVMVIANGREPYGSLPEPQ